MRAPPEARRWGYRDRACLRAGWEENRWRFGLRSRDELIPIPDCPVHSARVNGAAAVLAGALPPPSQLPVAFYVQAAAQATLVVKAKDGGTAGWLDHDVQARLERLGLEGLWAHFNPCSGRRLFRRDGWRLLWGRPRSTDASGLVYGPAAFQQPIASLHRASLREAEAFLACRPGARVADLCCGLGASLARWTACGADAIGVELGGEAVDCVRSNAPEAPVLRGLCQHRLPQLEAWSACGHGERLLYANPPRTGLEREVTAWIGERYRPARLAYLSCSAGTLRRDLDALTGCGYRVERITPYDFFPQTHHVEAQALVSREPRPKTGPA